MEETSLRLEDDFNGYINNQWFNNNPIPNEYSSWGNFTILDNQNKDRVLDLLKDDNNIPISNELLFVKNLYQQYTNKQDSNTFNSFIDKINNISNITEFNKVLLELLSKQLVSGPITFHVYPDMKNSNINILYLTISGLGLPDRDYYLLDDKKDFREKYKTFIKEFSNINSDNIFEFEKEMAILTFTRTERRDPEKTYHLYNLEKYESEFNNLLCREIFELGKLNIDKDSKFVVSNPDLFKFINHKLETDLDTVKQYLLWNFINENKPLLSEENHKFKFENYSKYISGAKELQPLWKRALNYLDSQVGQIIGMEFCKRYFTEDDKNNVLTMVNYILDELKDRLKNNSWMLANTKEKALLKLSKMRVKIGYPNPEGLRDYSSITTVEQSLFDTHIKINQFDVIYNLSKYNQEKNKEEMHMNPHTVNAYYSPLNNEIVFPAGILQEPFYTSGGNMALNFGAIGAIIGHEITHGFDDQGRKFDENGNFNNWWLEEDLNNYQSITNKIKDRYSTYMVNGKNLNGELTLGENIADIGGLSISLDAYKRYLQNQYLNEDSYNVKLREFFFAFGKVWRMHTREEEENNRLLTDPHSPPRYRVNGTVSSINDFYTLFNINITDKMYLPIEERISLW
ncbi:M13 family peptidase [Chlorella virus XW01]|nr:M13 family peptidase [Chlorella virus XW01]